MFSIPGVDRNRNLPFGPTPQPQSPRFQQQAATQKPLSSKAWILPIIGMSARPGQYVEGGSPAWSQGSFHYQKPASKGGHIHQGIDIYANLGTSVVAPVAGVVQTIGDGRISGKYVKVLGDDGNLYYYAHLNSIGNISRGMRVNGGTVLGGVGNTGNASGTHPHLHFEVRRNGVSINPATFFQTGSSQSTTPLSAIPGLNTVEEVQAYLDEMYNAAVTQARMDLAEGFDPSTWGQEQAPSAEDQQLAQTRQGQTMLGNVLDGMSNILAGGTRQPLPRVQQSSALGDELSAPVPTAEQQRQPQA